MAVLKVACPKCGQRVSGDETFYGTTVECPVCTSKVAFPENPHSKPPPEEKKPEPKPEEKPEKSGIGDETALSEETSSIPLSLPVESPRPHGGDEHPGSPLLGVISMVAGIVTVVCLCLPGILLGPIAVICGHMGLASSRRSRLKPAPGENLALTGMILGYVGMAVSLVYLVILAFPELPQNLRSGFGGGSEQ